ncbi:MAG: lysophospholipase [Saprospiraceae bacterium]|nr:lysophospholipase [Saprospiraceae bacterium]
MSNFDVHEVDFISGLSVGLAGIDHSISDPTMTHPTQTITFSFAHGQVEGLWCGPEDANDLVVITNGHNGFYNYGMFPWIQQQLADAGIASFSYNFSHGGTEGDGDVFTDLEAYEKNCLRLETADLVGVVQRMLDRSSGKRIWLLAHSMGSIPTVFGANELGQMHIPMAGMILLAPVSCVDFWPAELIERWATTGTITMFNRRTGQDLPHGPEWLSEIQDAATTWNMERAFKRLTCPVTVIHGAEDEAVSPDHGRAIADWVKDSGHSSTLSLIPGAGHTFGTRHPFDGPSTETKRMITEVIQSVSSRDSS